MDKVPALVCNKRVIESLVKAGAFDDMKHKRRALVAIHETAVDQYVDIKRNEAIGQDSLFGGLDDEGGESGFGISVTIPDIDEWDKMTLLGHEREMLGLYVSDHPLLGLEHVLVQRHRLHHRPADARRGARRRLRRSRSAAWSPACSARSPSAATPGRWSPSRTSTAPSTCCSSRAPTSWPAPTSSRTRSSPSRAGSRDSKDQPEIHGQEVSVPDLSDGPSGPVVISLPSTRCTPPVVEQLKDVLRHPPGRDRGAAAAADPRRRRRDAPRRPAPGHARARRSSPTSSSSSGPDA